MLGRMTQHFERESPLFIILTIELHIQGDRPKEKAVGMEDDAAPLGDVAGGAMVEAGGGEQTGTTDRQNQQSSTNSSGATERRSTTCCRTQRKESRTRAPPQSTTQRSAAPTHQGGASSRGRKGATLRRGAEGRSMLLDEVSRRHPSVQGCRLQGGWELCYHVRKNDLTPIY